MGGVSASHHPVVRIKRSPSLNTSNPFTCKFSQFCSLDRPCCCIVFYLCVALWKIADRRFNPTWHRPICAGLWRVQQRFRTVSPGWVELTFKNVRGRRTSKFIKQSLYINIFKVGSLGILTLIPKLLSKGGLEIDSQTVKNPLWFAVNLMNRCKWSPLKFEFHPWEEEEVDLCQIRLYRVGRMRKQ